jgi:hypothetical protein
MADANNNETTEMGCNADFGQGQRLNWSTARPESFGLRQARVSKRQTCG